MLRIDTKSQDASYKNRKSAYTRSRSYLTRKPADSGIPTEKRKSSSKVSISELLSMSAPHLRLRRADQCSRQLQPVATCKQLVVSNPGARTSARWLGVPRNLIPVRTSGCRMENSGCCLRSPSLSLVCFSTFQQNRLRARVLCRLWAEPCQCLYRRVCMCPS